MGHFVFKVPVEIKAKRNITVAIYADDIDAAKEQVNTWLADGARDFFVEDISLSKKSFTAGKPRRVGPGKSDYIVAGDQVVRTKDGSKKSTVELDADRLVAIGKARVQSILGQFRASDNIEEMDKWMRIIDHIEANDMWRNSDANLSIEPAPEEDEDCPFA